MGMLDLEFSAGGLLLYVFSFLFLAVPFLIWALEDISRKKNKKASGLPAASRTLPKPPPTKIAEIRIFPIKSCRGIKLQSAKLLKTGLDLDRNWMFVDAEKMDFLTIRQISDMTLITTRISDDDQLVVTVPSRGPQLTFAVPAHPSRAWLEQHTTLEKVTIWDQTLDAWAYPAQMTKPFDDFFGRPIRFVLKGPTPRILKGNAAPRILGREESTKFADVLPVLVANQGSIDELNQRLEAADEGPISIERFRPNIVLEAGEPWNEDTWKTVRLSDTQTDDEPLTMDVVARCARCQVPNVDPETAVKHQKQPWDTLMTYRRVDEGMKYKPCFGMLCVPRSEGDVKVGMRFEISEVTDEHKYIKGF